MSFFEFNLKILLFLGHLFHICFQHSFTINAPSASVLKEMIEEARTSATTANDVIMIALLFVTSSFHPFHILIIGPAMRTRP